MTHDSPAHLWTRVCVGGYINSFSIQLGPPNTRNNKIWEILGCITIQMSRIHPTPCEKSEFLYTKERDVAPWWSGRSWCDGSSDQSFMVDPLSNFSFQPVFLNWYNKCCGMYYPACGLVRMKESKRGNLIRYFVGYSFNTNSKGSFICTIPMNKTVYTSCGAPTGT